tara:strand:+ start:942 stop:2093 length:1152 start_codon:yes stop_codon:yes gene_type:complete
MAFSIGAFLGGFAGGGSQLLDEKRASDEKKKVTAEQRQWQIATEARADSRAKKARRDAEQETLDDLIEDASVYYNPDQMLDLSKRGKSELVFAVARAKELDSQGVKAGDMYKLPSVTKISDLPTGSDVASTKTSGSFRSRFASTATPDTFSGSTDEGHLIFFREKARTAKSDEERIKFENLVVETQNTISENNKEKDGTFKPADIKSANQSIQDIVDSRFDTAGLLQKDPSGQYVQRLQSNEPEGFRLIGDSYKTVRNLKDFQEGSLLDGILKTREAENKSRINSYVVGVANDYQKFLAAENTLKSLPEGSNRDKQEDIVAALQATKNNFIPLDAVNPLTPDKVRNSLHQTVGVNKVIQVQLDDTGKMGYVLTTTNGIIKLGF